MTLLISRSYNPKRSTGSVQAALAGLPALRESAPWCGREVGLTQPTEQEATVSKALATRALFADALAGRIDRRTLFTRAAALGLSVPVLGALANETARTALAAFP